MGYGLCVMCIGIMYNPYPPLPLPAKDSTELVMVRVGGIPDVVWHCIGVAEMFRVARRVR